ncbi:MAG: hypothetical protein JO245_07205 [Pseudolabrys sp.]|nr:hypothetical protein [Pseudolabrys sp.]
MRLISAALFAAAAFAVAAPALADEKVPTPFVQEILIKTAILTVNDANITGNYSVLHAKLAKAFRDKTSPDALKQAFKSFADQKLDLGLISAMPAVASSEAKINTARGSLELRGYFDTKPSRVTYELDFLPSEGQWKPAQIDVRVRTPASQ